MSAAATATAPLLNEALVRKHLTMFKPLVGGWCTPHPDDASGTSHYFHVEGEGEQAIARTTALCGITDNRNELDLDEVDPMALENCKACRLALLKARKLV